MQVATFYEFSFTASDFNGVTSNVDSVPFGDTFFLVGGIHNGSDSDLIFMYSPTDDSWIQMEGRLESGKYDSTAMLVQRSLFPDC